MILVAYCFLYVFLNTNGILQIMKIKMEINSSYLILPWERLKVNFRFQFPR